MSGAARQENGAVALGWLKIITTHMHSLGIFTKLGAKSQTAARIASRSCYPVILASTMWAIYNASWHTACDSGSLHPRPHV